MFARLSVDIGRKFLKTTVCFQNVTECQFSRLAHNSINRRLEKGIIFNNRKHSKVYGTYFVRYESTVHVTGKEAVSNTPSAQTQGVVNINDAVPAKDLLSEIPEIAQAVHAVHANGEATLESIGLGGYSPIGLIQMYFEWLHISCDLPWWAAVVSTAFVLKIVTFPFAVNAQKNSVKMQNVMPEVLELQERMTEARKSGNMQEAAMQAYEFQQYFKRNKIKMFPISAMLRFGLHVPIFVALREMGNAPVESLKDGGLWWFTDLSACDPYYILPLCTSVTMFLVTEYMLKSNAAKLTPLMIYSLRGIPVISFLFAMNFPGVLLCYWVTSNFLTIIENALFKTDTVKRILKFPAIIKHPQKTKILNKTFKEAFIDSWSNMKVSTKLADHARADIIQFNEAAKGPLTKTFKYNPLNNVQKGTSAASMSAIKK
ncbi:unnamed protein product [Xylocopa violacea]|uniref:Membrane insertase YidC/Oxa/ALB C-terminal domain-containing protein n=1 Tax=Xylocopa violacea TaxID=135666 RepID=A0ABP1N5Q6_XYLVO